MSTSTPPPQRQVHPESQNSIQVFFPGVTVRTKKDYTQFRWFSTNVNPFLPFLSFSRDYFIITSALDPSQWSQDQVAMMLKTTRKHFWPSDCNRLSSPHSLCYVPHSSSLMQKQQGQQQHHKHLGQCDTRIPEGPLHDSFFHSN